MTIDLTDVQGNVVRGYGLSYDRARHFVVGVSDDPGPARAFLGELAHGDTYEGVNVTPGTEWDEGHKPESCLNVGITWAGLGRLGVAPNVLAAFPPAFQQGPATRAVPATDEETDVGLGDVGESAPETWRMGGPENPEVHLVISVSSRGDGPLEATTVGVRRALADFGLTEHSCHDAQGLPSRGRAAGRVHFGYVDGIGQPRIAGAPGKPQPPDMQDEMPTGDLLLGCDYENSFGGNFAGDLPGSLVDNATYGAFRILHQNAGGFEALLLQWSAATGLDRELIAAKLMGRWRNGVPLVLSPSTDAPTPALPETRMNDFDYVSSDTHPEIYDDSQGLRCPIGAHARRLNPRGSAVMGTPSRRRVVRRSMPYGPELASGATADDGVDRGLIGYFLCGDLEAQFEFILRAWVNADFSANGIRGTREPIMGTQPPGGGRFRVHVNGGPRPITLNGLPTLVTTCGSAYCLLPGLGGLRYLASLHDPKAVHA